MPSKISLLLALSSIPAISGLAVSLPLPKFIGFDLGTSGARISVIESTLEGGGGASGAPPFREIYTQAVAWDDPYKKYVGSSSFDDPDAWMNAIAILMEGAAQAVDESTSQPLASVESICVSGTSASCLIVDVKEKKVTRNPRMYNYDVVASRGDNEDPIYAFKAMELLDKYAPDRHTAKARSGSLAKLLTWNEERRLSDSEVLCHQSDYVTMLLQSNSRARAADSKNTWAVNSDWHNCLKLGYDVQNLVWPDWMSDCLQEATGMKNPFKVLPQRVLSPGEPMGTVSEDVAERFGLSQVCTVVGGTTDSNAAFFAAAGSKPALGTAVTSLGSTLAIKYLSATYLENSDLGVYSHRFPSSFSTGKDVCWLAGGASNVGCAVLRQEGFSDDELIYLSSQIDPGTDSPLDYYPLTKTGERFPVADSHLEPILTPKPDSRIQYLHGILQGIGNVERDGFRALGDLGAFPAQPSVVLTCGGGSRNKTWCQMRERRLNKSFNREDIKVMKADNIEASYGASLLAAASFAA